MKTVDNEWYIVIKAYNFTVEREKELHVCLNCVSDLHYLYI